MCGGKELQRVGVAAEKARSAKVQCLVLVMEVRRLESEDGEGTRVGVKEEVIGDFQ